MNEQILTTVEAALQRARVLRPGATLLVALSGGADSVALLRAVCALGAKHGFVTRAAHVEHGLRGAASREDALFCERLCAGLSVPFTLDHARLQGGMCAPGAENRAREARYALLIARAKACRADGLLLAHHLDDQAETVLARLIRGSGARGLSGMRECTVWQGVTLLRPLLSLSRESLLASLEGQPYRTDETNRMPCCQRNRLRAGVLPLLAEENPQAASHIAQSAALLAMDDACLQAQTDALFHAALTDRPPILCVRREPLAQAP
ncbi:MAG TPA: tRNA lysidine(34) synthetase TilS, partial [Candidatus Limiplasma sp.]|nr:tRNA lysidine(34) synthetase TilS [Candidatus Limiplasma sp.]